MLIQLRYAWQLTFYTSGIYSPKDSVMAQASFDAIDSHRQVLQPRTFQSLPDCCCLSTSELATNHPHLLVFLGGEDVHDVGRAARCDVQRELLVFRCVG